MSVSAAADRYARAIFELGTEANTLKQVSEEIGRFAEAYESSEDLQAVLDNPLVGQEERTAVLRAISSRLGLSELALNSVRLLAARHRLSAISQVAARLQTLADEREGIVRVEVTSATPLDQEYYDTLSKRLEGVLNARVEIERKQDPSLIAGVVTRIGDNTIDGSVRGRLAELQRRLLQAS